MTRPSDTFRAEGLSWHAHQKQQRDRPAHARNQLAPIPFLEQHVCLFGLSHFNMSTHLAVALTSFSPLLQDPPRLDISPTPVL